jgi:hypothetical protein
MGKKVENIAKKGLSVMTLGASNYISKKLGKKPPQPGEPDAAPVPDDEQSLLANRRKMAQRATGGRKSTILSNPKGNIL